ncbi:hypothetical protein GLOIN_2v1780196 [Rhizophagus clarus]|uniref:Uncharacterized protein n=1 Tax=Rhizophagus clarus TaxID=94130 RepID=A0A8H3LHE3_9GLOM|nr:hypothetical protein GLOIN_2v1780196 [Rhizophagus clarus]
MDFESAFIGNEENFKEAFANNTNISNFISKIKNFIYYSDVETAMKLGNKNLAGVLWLGRLLERRDTNAKAVILDTNIKLTTKQTRVSPIPVTPITITDDNTSTVHSPDFTDNLSLTGNLMADHSGLYGKDEETNIHIHKDDINEDNPLPKSSETNTISTQPTTETAESSRKLHGGKLKKAKKRTPPTTLTTEANSDDIKGLLQALPPHQSAHEVNMPVPMKGIINIPAAFNPSPPSEVTSPMDLDLIDLNASQSHEDAKPKTAHPSGNAHVNPYIQDLKSLSEDTFMFNSSSNGAHDQLADPPDKEVPDDHPIIVSTALDNLKIISDDTPLPNPNKDQQSETFFTPKHSFLPNCQRVSEEFHENDYETTILPNGNWTTIKKIKNLKAVLDALKSSTTRGSNNTSMHAKIEEDALITYDAYVKLSDIEEYFAVDNKVAYVELLTRDFRGFLGTEINKEDNEIIIKNSSYKGMLHMVRLFNHKCRSHPFLRMHQKTYFLVDGMRVSLKEFKILNVPKHLSRNTIEQAVTKLLGSRRFFIKKSGLKPSKNNPDTITVFITVKDLDKCKQLKDIWSIEIDRILYRFAPAHAKDTDIVSRKKYSGKFVGFDDQTTPAAIQEAYTAQNPHHVYRQSDDKFIIEFSTECSPRDYNINWSARNKKLAKIPTIRPPPPDKRVSITHQEDSHHIEIRQEEHHKFSHNPHKHNLKNKQCFSSKPTNPKPLHKRTPHFTGANAVALDKRINSTIITNLPSIDISDTSDTSSSSNSLTNHKERIVEGARIIFNNNNLDCMDHSINFINLKIGFHNINGLASDPDKLKFLLEWCHANNFDFMGIAETNSHCINLQHFIKDTYDDCLYDLAGSLKSIIKPKGSGVALLIHSKWQKFHFDTKIFSPYLMVSKFGTKHRQLWIWVYYLPPTDKQTLRTFEQIMNNTTSDSHIIHI